MRKVLDVNLAKSLGWTAKTNLTTGTELTIKSLDELNKH